MFTRYLPALLIVLASSAAQAQQLSINDVSQGEGNGTTTTFTFTVSLDAPAATAVTFDVATADGTASAPSDYVQKSLVGQTIPQGSTTYTFDVTVNGDLAKEPNETFFVNVTNVTGATVADGQGLGTILDDDVTPTRIHDIQGNGAASPIVGTTVTTSGVVTGVKSDGFFIEAPDVDVDADPNTSEAIFVTTASPPPAAAAFSSFVYVSGTIVEATFPGDPQTSTQLTLSAIWQDTASVPLPTAMPLTGNLPYALGAFNQLQSVEHMRVSVTSMTVSGPGTGVISETAGTAASDGNFYGVLTGIARPFREPGIPAPDSPATGSIPPIPRWDSNPERIRVETAGLNGLPALPAVSSGDMIGPLAGPLDYSSRTYILRRDGTTTPTITPGTLTTTVTAAAGNEVTVASINLHRFYDNVDDAGPDPVLSAGAFDTRLAKTSIAIRTHLRSPDIIGVQEVENLATLTALATRIQSDGGPQYAPYLIEGPDPEGLDVGLLVKVSPVGGGVPRVTVSNVAQQLNTSVWTDPRDNTQQPLHDRPPLLLEAVVNRAPTVSFPIVVVVTDLLGLTGIDSTTPDGLTTVGARVRAKRLAQAQDIANYVQARQTTNATEHLLVVGGFNAFQFNDGHVDVVNTIIGTPPPDNQTEVPGDGVDLVNPDLVNLTTTAAATERYSVVLEGNAASLDHALVSAGLVNATTSRRLERARIAADYQVDQYSNPANAIRFAERDPLVVYFAVSGLVFSDLTLTNADAPDPVIAGQPLAYTITVANNGPDPASTVTWNDTLPAGTTFQSLASPGGWACTTPAVGAGGTVSCSMASLNSGVNAVFTLTLGVSSALTPGTILSNTAQVSTATPDATPGNNTATATTTVQGVTPPPPPPPPPTALTYYLAEGATGSFFDEDLLIANPNTTAAPVTLTFFREGLPSITDTRTLAAKSSTRLQVDTIPGLESAAVSVQVTSTNGLPLAVERTQFWGVGSYGGTTETAVTAPAMRWYFAEGSQGYFDTFVLIANPQSTPVDLTLTFLREGETPATTTARVDPFSRTTIWAATIPELINRSFAIIVDATQPVVAERAMYFGTTATRPWSGGAAAAGVTAPATTWYFAEGATGSFFDTFLLLMNPDANDAHATMRYLLDSGDTIDVPKTVPGHGRLTVNVETEPDPRLLGAAMSTVITSDRPIVAERSVYWPTAEGAQPWGESHSSAGTTVAGARWVLAEGRSGGPLNFHTYVLLGNFGQQAVDVTVEFLPDSGSPIVKTYNVPAARRFTIDATVEVPELIGHTFGMLVTTAGDRPIVVERSMYWDGAGLTWSGGTNAVGTRLP